MVRIVLIFLVMLSWGGGIIAYYGSYQMSNMPTYCYFSLPLIIILNILRAKYLHTKAQNKKAEWALFGLLGNISALPAFWIWSYCISRWEKGKSVLEIVLMSR
jgi:hypothetical protein